MQRKQFDYIFCPYCVIESEKKEHGYAPDGLLIEYNPIGFDVICYRFHQFSIESMANEVGWLIKEQPFNEDKARIFLKSINNLGSRIRYIESFRIRC